MNLQMSSRRSEGTNAIDLKRRQLTHEGIRNWNWYEWIYGNHLKETLSKKRKKLGEYFVKYVSTYSGIPTEYRCDVWKTLLGVNEDISAKEYIRLIKLGRVMSTKRLNAIHFVLWQPIRNSSP